MSAIGSTKRKHTTYKPRTAARSVNAADSIYLPPQNALLVLQHKAGNQAVLNMVRLANDNKYGINNKHRLDLEKQADQSANAMLNQQASSASEESNRLPQTVLLTLQDQQHGRSLSLASRAFFEPRLGYQLGAVRLHADRNAALSARALQARAFTLGNDIYFGAGEYAPSTQQGKHLLAHELSHVVQQAINGGTQAVVPQMQESKGQKPAFDTNKWFYTFRLSAVYALSQYYITEGDVNIRQVASFKSGEDKTHPAHYNPNDGKIYFSTLGWRLNYEERVLAAKGGSEKEFENLVVEAAIEEAFHAYQNAPRQRSKAFDAYIKSIEKTILYDELVNNMTKLGMPENYEKFKSTWIAHLTDKYLPKSKIDTFVAENMPQMHRNPKWQLDARQEILNQWLKVLDGYYFRARGMASGIRKLSKQAPLTEEPVHRVSLIEKQAAKTATLRRTEVKLWLITKRLEAEKDPEKQLKLKRDIEALKARSDISQIPLLEKKKKALEKEFMALGYTKKDLERSAEVAHELNQLGDDLDYLVSLRDGIASLFKQKGWLIKE